jgi:hypothetical protein
VDDEEEKEFGIHDSIVNHISQGTIANQNRLMPSHIGLIEGSDYYHNPSPNHGPQYLALDNLLGVSNMEAGHSGFTGGGGLNPNDRSKSTKNWK